MSYRYPSILSAYNETSKHLDSFVPREVSSVHELTVSCRDRGQQENADFARVSVTVEDSNDHEPVFLETVIVAKVSVAAAAQALKPKARLVCLTFKLKCHTN